MLQMRFQFDLLPWEWFGLTPLGVNINSLLRAFQFAEITAHTVFGPSNVNLPAYNAINIHRTNLVTSEAVCTA